MGALEHLRDYDLQSVPSALARDLVGYEFDEAFYREEYPELDADGFDAFEHYFQTGWLEGRDPSPAFSTSQYLAVNPDVAAARVNPLLHYVVYGRAERRMAPGRPDAGRRPPGCRARSSRRGPSTTPAKSDAGSTGKWPRCATTSIPSSMPTSMPTCAGPA